jgi:GNAT superfamily N-acetyltransferase
MSEVRERQWRRGEYTISTDNNLLDIRIVHDFISNHSYWAQGRPIEIVQRALDNSLNFGLYQNNQQIGFARVVTDYATFAWIADVFVLPEHRGQGLSKWLMEVMLSHPKLQGFRRWVLGNQRRTQFVCALRLHPASSARALDGTSRPEYAGESQLLEKRSFELRRI